MTSKVAQRCEAAKSRPVLAPWLKMIFVTAEVGERDKRIPYFYPLRQFGPSRAEAEAEDEDNEMGTKG